MRTGVNFEVSPDDRHRLDAIVRDRNAPQKHAWRAQIIICTADGLGTNAIMRATGKSKNCVWRWQERLAPSAPCELCAEEGVDGLLRDKTGPSRVPPLTQLDSSRRTEALSRDAPKQRIVAKSRRRPFASSPQRHALANPDRCRARGAAGAFLLPARSRRLGRHMRSMAPVYVQRRGIGRVGRPSGTAINAAA
jgi:hypothetical protein